MKKQLYAIICVFLCLVLVLALWRFSDAREGENVQNSAFTEDEERNQSQPDKGQAVEMSYDISELNGYLTEEELPDNFIFKDRLYIGGEANYYLIDLEGNLVRWGTNFDQADMGWDYDATSPQPFRLRNILVPNAQKLTFGFCTTFVLDKDGDLWGWGISAPLLLKEESEALNQPEKVMSSVNDIAAGDFYVAAVMNDGTLDIWGTEDGYREPISVQENVKSVCVIREMLFFIDLDSNLYYFPNGSSVNMDGFMEEPVLLDTDVDDVQYLNFRTILVLKTDGTVGIPNYTENQSFQVLAHDAQYINQSGYVSADGDFWHIICTEDNGVDTELEENTAYAIYNSMGDSLRILRDGRIEVGFSEDGMLSALSDGEGYQ
jgi:hypothetical protein